MIGTEVYYSLFFVISLSDWPSFFSGYFHQIYLRCSSMLVTTNKNWMHMII